MISRQYTVEDAAKILSVAERVVLRHIASGELEASDVSPGIQRPRWRISPEAICKFLEARRNEPPASMPVKRKRASKPAEEFV